jgi:Fe-S cluster assembly protein SufD
MSHNLISKKLINGFDQNNCFIINLDHFIKTQNLPIKHEIFSINISNNSFLINILDNVTIEKPIYLINDLNLHDNLTIIINSGQNNKFTLIDHKNNQNTTTNFVCENNTIVDYYLIQNMDNSKLQVQQNSNSLLNAKLLANHTSNNKLLLEINLLEPNAKTELNILQNTKQNSCNIIDLFINHLTTNSSSCTIARATALDQSSIELNGKIIVHKSATKTQADLQSKNLILSKQGSITSCPELLINNNDVVCTHGSSIGNLDPSALFYMQTRGISLQDATQMLLEAFLQPIIQKIKYQQIIDYLI